MGSEPLRDLTLGVVVFADDDLVWSRRQWRRHGVLGRKWSLHGLVLVIGTLRDISQSEREKDVKKQHDIKKAFRNIPERRDDPFSSGSPRPYPAAGCPGLAEPCVRHSWCLARLPHPRSPPPSPPPRSRRTSRSAPGSGYELPVPPGWWEEGSFLEKSGHRR